MINKLKFLYKRQNLYINNLKIFILLLGTLNTNTIIVIYCKHWISLILSFGKCGKYFAVIGKKGKIEHKYGKYVKTLPSYGKNWRFSKFG